MIVEPGLRCGSAALVIQNIAYTLVFSVMVELLVGELGQVLDVPLLGPVVHQDVQPAEPLDGLGDEVAAVRRVVEVPGQGEGLAARPR